MSQEFKSHEATVNAPAESIYSRLSNPENLRTLIDSIPPERIPADKREQLQKVVITPDSITLPGGPTGNVTLRLDRCECPTLISMKAADLPIDVIMELHMTPIDQDHTSIHSVIKADVPMMLRPMVKGPLQQVADKVVDLISGIPFA